MDQSLNFCIGLIGDFYSADEIGKQLHSAVTLSVSASAFARASSPYSVINSPALIPISFKYFEVITASNGPEALEKCQAGLCDIILLDVMMPGMDGYEVCRRLKKDARTAHLPVIMVTALDQPSDRLQGLEAGADDFLTKPINDIPVCEMILSK